MDFENFQMFTQDSQSIAFHSWLLVFYGSSKKVLENRCLNPTVNNLNLNINTRMLVKCYDNKEIREWYATKTKKEIEVFHLYDWTSEMGLTLRSRRHAYDRKRNFTGIELRLAAVKEHEQVPVLQNNAIKYMDMFQKMLLEVIQHLNFTVKLLPVVDTFGAFNNTTGKWSGLLGEIEAGHVDVPFTEFTILKDRAEKFDYTYAISQPQNCIYIKEPEVIRFKWKAYLQAFGYDVWIFLIVVILVTPVGLMYMKRKVSKYNNTRENNFISNFLYVWGVYCQQGMPFFPEASSLRTVFVMLFFSDLILIAIYSAFIVSYLTSLTIITSPFNTLAEFVKDETYKVIVFRNSAEVTLFTTTTDPVLSRMGKMVKPYEKLPLNSMEAFHQVCNEDKIAFYAEENKAQKVKLKNYLCKLMPVYTNGKRFMGFPLTKNNPLKNFINYYMLKFKENGIMNRIQTVYRQKYDDPINTFIAVGFWEITGALSIFSIGVILSILILSLEWIHYRRLLL